MSGANCFQPEGPPRDSGYTNISATNLVACNVATRSYVNAKFGSNIVILTEEPLATATYFLAPAGRRTIFRFDAPLTTNTTMNFEVDSSQSQIGDQMVWLFQNDIFPFTTIEMNLPNPGSTPPGPFYFTKCSSLSSSGTIRAATTPTDPFVSAPGREALYFTYDGEIWVSSFENC